jgi:hypothetical protein
MTDTKREAFEKLVFQLILEQGYCHAEQDAKVYLKRNEIGSYVHANTQLMFNGWQAALAHSHKPDYFGTEDEHFADSLEALAEQFLNSYNAGDEIEVHYTKDLGSDLYVYGFDVNGKPTLTPITNRKDE